LNDSLVLRNEEAPMTIATEATVAELVVQRPERARVFERLGIDYCCHGGRTLSEACDQAGMPVAAVRRELKAEDQKPPLTQEDWTAAPLGRLIDNIVEQHHSFLRRELPRVEQLMIKVAAHHGLRYRALLDVAEVFLALQNELLEHMLKEERVLFPLIRRLEAGEPAGFTVNCPIAVMEVEHRHAGEALQRIRDLTDNYAPPPDGCTAYRTLMAGLADLEADLHQHIHKENNILFPRAAALEESLAKEATLREPSSSQA
jgi:regulator of cell morphogenesis and NO signaling